MGGGTKSPEALRWFAEKAGGGDLVIVGAKDHPDELSNQESTFNAFRRLDCLRSITFLIVDSRSKADAPYVEELLRRADGIFLPGGDQTAYYDLWQGTRVARAINERMQARSVPIGGSSAGMHSIGRVLHAPEGSCSVASQDALQDPYLAPSAGLHTPGITLKESFLDVPTMENVLTDTHWSERDRMGRSIVFLARILQDGMRSAQEARLIACDEGVAVCVDGTGMARVYAAEMPRPASAFFIRPNGAPDVCRRREPLTWTAPAGALTAQRVVGDKEGTHCFDLATWKGPSTEEFQINVRHGRLEHPRASIG